jgi:hypothetical protein
MKDKGKQKRIRIRQEQLRDAALEEDDGGVPLMQTAKRRWLDWKWIVTAISAITAVVSTLIAVNSADVAKSQFRLNKDLAQRAWEAEAPFLDLKMGQERNGLPNSVQIKNVGRRAAYNVSLGAIAGTRTPQQREIGPPARPDPVPLPKIHLVAGEIIDAALPRINIPEENWRRTVAGREILDIFYSLDYDDDRGVHTEWFCYEYSVAISAFAACRDFRAPPDVWVSVGPWKSR